MGPGELGLEVLASHTTDALIVADRRSGQVVLWSPAAEALFGWSERDVLGRQLASLLSIGNKDASAAPRVLDRTIRSGSGAELRVEFTLSSLDDAPVPGSYLVVLARDVSDRGYLRVRAAAALRVARKLSAEPDHEHVLDELLREAVIMVECDGATVYRWDDQHAQLSIVRNTVRTTGTHIPSGQGAVGRAVEQRGPVIVNDYQHEPGMVAATAHAGVQAALAVPLLHEGRLLGALGVVSYDPRRQFDADDADLLELLASVAAAVLVGLERARLEGVLLAGRTTAHELGNTLAALLVQVQVLQRDPRLPADLRARTETIVKKVHEAAAKVQGLQELETLRETSWGTGGTTIKLD